MTMKFFKDPKFFAILFNNLLIAVIAIWQQWSVIEVIWVYCIQTGFLGVINFLKSRTLTYFCCVGVQIGDKPLPVDQEERVKAKNKIANLTFLFFAMIYFPLMPIFLSAITDNEIDTNTFGLIAICCLSYIVSNFYSVLRNMLNDKAIEERPPNIGALALFPILRAVFLVVFAIFVLFTNIYALLIFLLLQTAMDAYFYFYEKKHFTAKDEDLIYKF